MSELIKSYIVKNAEQLSPQQISAAGTFSHPSQLQSARYAEWIRLGSDGKYKELDAEIRKYAESDEAINSIRQLPSILRKPVEFAEYRNYDFRLEEFIKQIETEKTGDMFARDEAGNYREKSLFKASYSNIADQLIAEAKIPDLRPKAGFDKQAVLKTLALVERVVMGKRNFDIDLDRLYESPVIIDAHIFNFDPCPAPTRYEITGEATQNQSSDCECNCNTNCVSQNSCCAKITPYIAYLYVVKDEIRCYEVGEMSYIENVLQSEIRERVHRTLEREEILTETTEETSFSEEKDHQVDEKFSLQKEIDKTVEQELSLDAGVTAHQHWGTGDVTATTNAGYKQSKKDAQKSVQDYAKQIIDKSITKLERKVKEFSSTKLFRETEEKNKHIFGGTTGAPEDISRQFYYVNTVKKAQVFNYGKRMLIDFYLPEPSELYKRLVDQQLKLTKPVKPDLDIEDITDKNYLDLVKTYGIKDFETPPKMTTQIQIPINLDYGYSHTYTESLGFTVPDNYEAVSMHTGTFNFDSERDPWEFLMVLAGHTVSNTSSGNISSAQLAPPLTGGQTVVTKSYNLYVIQGGITIECQLLPEFRIKWQLSMYDKIMEAYQKELDAYNEALAAFEKNKQSKYQQNPFILLQDMQEQLKQAAISYISCQYFDAMDAMKHKVAPCGFPQMDPVEAEKEGEFVRFFEQAFEWKFMNFIFYPYFWGRKCTWEDKMKEQADNMLFQRFLKAGFARVSVSVRPGFEGHVAWFLQTKKIWGQSGQPPVAGPDFVPIYQEIKEDKENFNTDREGKIDVVKNSAAITLHGTKYYWNDGNPSALPPAAPHTDQHQIDLDIDREIFIDGKQYRIVDIQLLSAPDSWTITLDRPYESDDANNLPWSTGAVFVGAPWEFKIPTRLVWLREKGGCLPCYPIKCEEK